MLIEQHLHDIDLVFSEMASDVDLSTIGIKGQIQFKDKKVYAYKTVVIKAGYDNDDKANNCMCVLNETKS